MKKKHWTQTEEGRARMSQISKRSSRRRRRHSAAPSTNGAHRALAGAADLIIRLEAENKDLRRRLKRVETAFAR